jgi:cold-inducible RNA-binding protein
MPKKLYVGNLTYTVTNNDLNDLFSRLGKVESAAVVTDKFSGQSKGFGFVEMTDATEANNAIQSLDGTEFMGRNIKVNEAKPREASRGGGGGGRSGGGGGRSGGGGGGGRGNRW